MVLDKKVIVIKLAAKDAPPIKVIVGSLKEAAETWMAYRDQHCLDASHMKLS